MNIRLGGEEREYIMPKSLEPQAPTAPASGCVLEQPAKEKAGGRRGAHRGVNVVVDHVTVLGPSAEIADDVESDPNGACSGHRSLAETV